MTTPVIDVLKFQLGRHVTNPYPFSSFELPSGTVTITTNGVKNPALASSASGWFESGGKLGTPVRTAGAGVDGTYGFVGTATATLVAGGDGLQVGIQSAEDVAVVAGSSISPSIHVKSSRASRFTIRWAFYAGTLLLSAGNSAVAETQVAADTHVRLQTEAMTVPATATRMLIRAVPITGAGYDPIIAGDVLTVSKASTAPGPYFDGNSPASGDFEFAFTGTANASTSIMRAKGVLGINGTPGRGRIGFQSQEWADEGVSSLRIRSTGTPGASVGGMYLIGPGVEPTFADLGYSDGDVVTIVAKCRLVAPQTGAPAAQARSLWHILGGGTQLTYAQAPNVAGVHEVRLTITIVNAATDQIRLTHGADYTNDDIWWDVLTIVPGDYVGPPFVDETIEWRDYLGDAQTINITRGGAITVDVGLLTAELIRSDDPLAEEKILPGRPVRVALASTETPIFTGVVQDAHSGIERVGGGLTRNRITVTAVDAVASHAKNTRYGAVTDGGVGHETWAERITRLGMSSDTPVALPEEPTTPYPWECQDVAYTSSLANHFNLACQTIGANWWVGADNVTRFRGPDAADSPATTFSDELEDALQYLDIVIGAGTKRIVNVLKIENRGRGNDGNTFDVATTFQDNDSVAAWGVRAASTDMSVWDADTVLSGRAQEIFDAYADPVREVDQIVWDAMQDPSTAAALDIQSSIGVLFGGEPFDTRIVGVTHEIGPASWIMTIDTSTRGVPEAQAVSDAYADMSATGAEPIDRDARAPQAPANVTAVSFAAWQGGAILLALQTSWDDVTLGENGAPIGVSLYEVWARPDDGATPAKRFATTAGLDVAATDPELAIGSTWLVKVRAASDNGVWSPFSGEESVTISEPVEELDAPTPPSVSSRPGLGVAVWDGQLTTGTPPAALQDIIGETALDEHADDEDWSVRGTIFTGGEALQIAAPAGDGFWIRFRARDRLGRVSEPSAAVLVSIPSLPSAELDIPSLAVALISAGFAGQLDLTANTLVQIIAGQLGETRSVFRVTPLGAEVRQEGMAAYLALTATALQLYGPAGSVGAELTALGLETDLVKLNVLQFGDFAQWESSSDGEHLSLKEL